jgi:hypothetical protein
MRSEQFKSAAMPQGSTPTKFAVANRSHLLLANQANKFFDALTEKIIP